jgi:hypothetical protein
LFVIVGGKKMGRERGAAAREEERGGVSSRRGRRSAAASRRGEEGKARFKEGGTPAVVDPPPNPWGAGAAEEPRLSAGVAEEPRPSVVPLLRVAADGLPCLDFAWPERREKRGGWGRRSLELDPPPGSSTSHGRLASPQLAAQRR